MQKSILTLLLRFLQFSHAIEALARAASVLALPNCVTIGVDIDRDMGSDKFVPREPVI